jgi:hypothetical protein
MQICHEHNLSRLLSDKKFGIRLSLPPGDSLARILGPGWQTVRWYSTEFERDEALERMRGKHTYSRPGDFPTYKYSKVTREG